MSLASEQRVFDQAYSLAYEELRRLARAVLRSDRAATLTPTTLVNEAWLKLMHSPHVAETSTLHFRRIVARAMRQVLVDTARRKHSQSRGGGQPHLSFDQLPAEPALAHDLGSLLALDEALNALSKLSPRQAQLVEGRFFGGLQWTELAESLQISEATVMREWRAARAWLACEMRCTGNPHWGAPSD